MCLFSKNKARAEGGAVFMNGTITCTASSCTFSNNSAYHGGGIAANNCNSAALRFCHLNFNTAIEDGGAIKITGDESNVSISLSYFFNNQAKKGGAININNTLYVAISYTSFFYNRGNLGGAIATVSVIQQFPSLIILDSKFRYNFANKTGGALETDGYYVVISKTYFAWNYCRLASSIGGAVKINKGRWNSIKGQDKSVCFDSLKVNRSRSVMGDASNCVIRNTITACQFVMNIAGNGGALYLNDTDLNIINTTFHNNTAVFHGGAIFALDSSTNFDGY